MVYFKNNKWHLCTEKVRYVQHGEEITQYVGSEGHDWWVKFEQKWDHTTIIEFIPVEPTEEEIARLEKVNQFNVPDGFCELVGNYVEHGEFPVTYNHPLWQLQTQKGQELQNSYLIDLDFRQSLSELGV